MKISGGKVDPVLFNDQELISICLFSAFNNIAKVNHLGPSSNYHLFKQGIRPEWEDESNAEGGKFGIQFPKNKAGEAINDYWMYLVSFFFNVRKKFFLIDRFLKLAFGCHW